MRTIRSLTVCLMALVVLLVAALGATAASPSAPPRSSSPAPGRAADITAWVTGRIDFAGYPSGGTDVMTADGIDQSRGWSSDWPISMSDPRLSGRWIVSDGSSDTFGHPDELGVNWALVRIENGEGSWTGEGSGVSSPDGSWTDILWLRGDGAYDDLSAYLRIHWVPATSDFHGVVEGLIFPGNPPPDR